MSRVTAALSETMPLSDSERENSFAASRELAQVRAEQRHSLGKRPMTEERWARFILAVRETGSLQYAAARADGDRAWAIAPVYARMIREDVLRAKEFEGAVNFWHSKIAGEIYRRAIEGVDVPKFHEGAIVAYVKEYDSNLTRLMAAEHLKWVEKRQDSTVHVDNLAPPDDSIFSLSADVALRMDSVTRDHLRAVLEWCKQDRAQDRGAAIVAEPEELPLLVEDAAPEGTEAGKYELSEQERAELAEINA